MARRLDGTNPLSYLGVRPPTPPNMVVPGNKPTSAPRDPTQNDINYNLGDFWLNTAGPTLWYLSFLGSHLVSGINTRYANWLPFVQGSGFVQHLSGDSGINPVSIDGANNINVFGDHTVGLTVSGDGVHTLLVTSQSGRHFGEEITGNSGGAVPFTNTGNINFVGDGITVNVVGNPGTNTLTISAIGTGMVETLTGNSGGAVGPTAGNINIVGAAGLGLTVVGNPGTHTLTITSASGGSVGQSVTTGDGHVVLPDSVGNWNFAGAHGINTTGVVATHTYTAAINNTITLGDLAVVTTGNDALTITSGNITLSGTGANAAGNINMPFTSSDGRQGIINVNGQRFISNFDNGLGTNLFVGYQSGTLLNFGGAEGANVGFGTGALGNISAGGNGAQGNTAIGHFALGTYTFTTTPAVSGGNTAVGTEVLFRMTTGGLNTGVGWQSLSNVTTGAYNTTLGGGALSGLTTGTNNIGIGHGVGTNSGVPSNLLTGSFNLMIGEGAGNAYSNAESSNLLIQNAGVTGENNIMRIGTTGAGNAQQNKCFIAAIRGVTTDNNNAIAVLIDSAGQLGTVSSSMRYKENINDMGDYSSQIMDLRPVTFDYKNRSSIRKSVGLIAEEVVETMPDLVVFDEEGLPETIQYHNLVPMLLNEVQKLRRELNSLKDMVKTLH